MLITKLDKRYAKSLLELAVEMGKLEEVKKDIETIISVIDESREFRLLLRSPLVPGNKKEEIFKAVFGDSLGEITNNFISIVTRRAREGELEGIVKGFMALYRKEKGIEEATITSAHPLNAKQEEEIRTKLAKVTGFEIEVIKKVDPEMIGGIKVSVGDKQYNGSVAYQLEQLKRSFATTHHISKI